MPYSDPRFDDAVRSIVRNSDHTHFFDIGCGSGKFGTIAREEKGTAAILTGVEIEQAYIEQFKLADIYDTVHNTDIIDFIDARPSFSTDFVYIGDCIEHLKKSDGIDLLHYLIYRSKQIVLVIPDKYIQYDWHGHASEAHRSVWDASDFSQFDYTHQKDGFMNLYTVRGYLDDPDAVFDATEDESAQVEKA